MEEGSKKSRVGVHLNFRELGELDAFRLRQRTSRSAAMRELVLRGMSADEARKNPEGGEKTLCVQS
jgi:hypothetical protein